MKKDQKRQARRARALERFSITVADHGRTPDAQKAYLERKRVEEAALRKALGL
jgi:hypothetical protein